MIIQHNIMALNTLNKFHKNTLNAEKSLKKLSSGLRINTAADDAAGLANSEKMRAQIRGLQQARQNIQDGISLIQVADGALDKIQGLNQRMRELIIQGSNDTLTYSDKKAIQEELNQLMNSIEKIASNTQFNTRRLLDGSLEIPSAPKTPLGFEWKVNFEHPIELTSIIATNDGGMVVGGTKEIKGNGDTTYSLCSYIAKLNSEGQREWEKEISIDNENISL